MKENIRSEKKKLIELNDILFCYVEWQWLRFSNQETININRNTVSRLKTKFRKSMIRF